VPCKLEPRKIKNSTLAATCVPYPKDLAASAWEQWKHSARAEVRAHQLLHVLPNHYRSKLIFGQVVLVLS